MNPRRMRVTRMRRADTASGWSGWQMRDRSLGDPLEDQLGRPGLWQFARRGLVDDDGIKQFLYPDLVHLASLTGSEAWRQDPASLESDIRAWARATSHAKLPSGWAPPSPDEVSTWFAAERLTVRAGPHLARGGLECDAEALRVVFPELIRLSDALPDARRAWARELCFDAQSRWHTVRFGLADDRVRAEIDLSGVPEAIAQPLFTFAFEALVFSVRWVLPSLALVSDPSAASHVLDRGPWWRPETATLRSTRGPVRPPEIAGG